MEHILATLCGLGVDSAETSHCTNDRTWPSFDQNVQSESRGRRQSAALMGQKRTHAIMASHDEAGSASSTSPYIGLFEHFRAELDEHHDRRERIIKASRDITAASKKM